MLQHHLAILSDADVSCCRYVCLYDVDERLLLRRIQISFNRSLDGILDSLDSRNVTDAGPLALIDDSDSDDDGLLPSVAPGELLAVWW